MELLEQFGKCSGCLIPRRHCWKTQEFVDRGILHGGSGSIPPSFCFLKSMIHNALHIHLEAVEEIEIISFKQIDASKLDMDKMYFIP